MSKQKRPKRRRRTAKDSFERRALRNAWANLELFEAQLSALDFATRDLCHNAHRAEHEREVASNAWWTLRSVIHAKFMEAHRIIFMFAHVGTEEDKEEAKKLAYRSFFKKDYGIMHLLEYGFRHPSSWRVTEEQVARADVEKALNGRDVVPTMKVMLDELRPLTAVYELSDGETLPPVSDMLDILLDILVSRPFGLDRNETSPTRIVAAIQSLFRFVSSDDDEEDHEARNAFELIQKIEEQLSTALDAIEYTEFTEDDEDRW